MVVAVPPSGIGGVHRYRSGNAFGGLILSFNVHVWFEAGMREVQFCPLGDTIPVSGTGCQALDGSGEQTTLCHLKVSVMLSGKGWPVKRILQFLALVPSLQIYNFIWSKSSL